MFGSAIDIRRLTPPQSFARGVSLEAVSPPSINWRSCDEIKKYSSRNNIVLAVGGGAVTFKKSYDLMASMCCIYLKTSMQVLTDRLEGDSSRPLLKENNKRQMLEKIFNERKELYLSLSSCEINTDRNSLSDNCDKIMEFVNG